MDILFALTAAALYFAALLKIVPGLLEPNQIATHRVFTLALLALIFHAGTLVDLILQDSGQNLSILNVASLVSFILAAIATSLMLRMRIWILLPVVYTFSAINLMAATLLPSNVLIHLETKPEVLIHIALAIFAYATLMLATLYAIQLAWLDHQLKTKKRNVINPNLPPLMAVERQLFKVILVGEALLTVSLVTGFIFVDDMFAQGKSHKAVLSSMAWSIYAILIWGHYTKHWRGRRIIWFSVIGAFLLTLAYFGSRIVREVIIAS